MNAIQYIKENQNLAVVFVKWTKRHSYNLANLEKAPAITTLAIITDFLNDMNIQVVTNRWGVQIIPVGIVADFAKRSSITGKHQMSYNQAIGNLAGLRMLNQVLDKINEPEPPDETCPF